MFRPIIIGTHDLPALVYSNAAAFVSSQNHPPSSKPSARNEELNRNVRCRISYGLGPLPQASSTRKGGSYTEPLGLTPELP